MTRKSQYRTMWILVLFDLPTQTKSDIKKYTQFRKKLLEDGFGMMQYSIYSRYCDSSEQADVHTERVKSILPEKGQVVILRITDKQFGNMQIFYGKSPIRNKRPPQQLELF
ncbi:MAG: CRISPR-associated endonuclease Cas2 [Paludibacteraceae bacterium]|nr:CRISPR-associated endonuclease Cas2 [Paludibacteraceae bacterium]